MRRKSCGAFVGIVVLASCSSENVGNQSAPGKLEQAQTTIIPETGFVPYPVALDGNGEPAEDPNGENIAAWDTGVAQLLAADAYAQCAFSNSFYGSLLSTNTRGMDEFLFAVQGAMGVAACDPEFPGSLSPINPGSAPEEHWVVSRQNPNCNIDINSGLKAVIPVPQREANAYSNFSGNWNWPSFIDASALQGSGWSGFDAFTKAAEALAYAELNLCIAERLDEQANSGSIVFASDEEQLELAGFIRERAQLATVQYSLIGKVLASTDAIPTAIQDVHEYLPFLRRWASLASSATSVQAIGDDFATAVRLHLRSTYEFASLLRRQASARPGLTQSGRALADWGPFSPRVRLLNLLYGGDPLTDSATPEPGRTAGGLPLRDLPFVTSDMRSPEIQTLLGLSRAADVLLLKLETVGVPGSYTEMQIAAAFASSVENNHSGFAASKAIDDDLNTRWSSQFFDPQWIQLDLGNARRINRVLLTWHSVNSYSKDYDLQISDNFNGPWTTIYTDSNGNGGTDDITGLNTVTRYIRLWSRQRSASFGNSLKEFEVFASNDVGDGFDVTASAERLYTETERHLRLEDCEIRDDEECDNAETIPGVSDPADFLLWQRHRIQPSHAQELVAALAQALEPASHGSFIHATSDNGYGFNAPMFHFRGHHEIEQIASHPWFHLDPQFVVESVSGSELTSRFDAGHFLPGDVDLDVNALQQGFVATRHLLIDASQNRNGLGGTWEAIRRLGAVPALIFAREAIVQGTQATGNAAGYFEGPSDVLRLIEAAVGQTTAAIRPSFSTVQTSQNCPTELLPAPCEILQQQTSSGSPQFLVDVLAPSDSPFNELAAGEYLRDMQTAAMDPGYESFHGVTREDVDDLPRLQPSVQSYTSYASNLERQRYTVTAPTAGAAKAITLLAGEVDGTVAYLPLNALPTAPEGGYYVSFGGTLNEMAERVWEVQPQDWSKPAQDAFDLPVDWVPPADASLVGGTSGEESYQYFLRSAKAAAEEATTAVQTAIDTVVAEATDSVALSNAEQRASEIGEIETSAVCGQSSDCSVGEQRWVPAVSDLALLCGEAPLGGDDGLSGFGLMFCRLLVLRQLKAHIGPVQLAAPVVEQEDWASPDFSDFAGGSLERVLMSQWTAMRELKQAIDTAGLYARSTAARIVASEADLTAAKATRDSIRAQVDARAAELSGDYLELNVEQRGLDATHDVVVGDQDYLCCTTVVQNVNEQVDAGCTDPVCEDAEERWTNYYTNIYGVPNAQTIQDTMGAFCNALLQSKPEELADCLAALDQIELPIPPHVQAAIDQQVHSSLLSGADCGLLNGLRSGITHSGSDDFGTQISMNENGQITWNTGGIEGGSFSEQGWYSAAEQCRQATNAVTVDNQTYQPSIDALNQQKAAIELQISTNGTPDDPSDDFPLPGGPLALQEAAADADYEAARAGNLGARADALAQFASQLSIVEQAFGAVLRASADLQGALMQKDLGIARAELELALTSNEINTRFGLRRKFRSYDLWRAQALLENSRRLSVAARRAIEARFVVDLSELDASQVFVEAPSLWADEIYDSDLAAPTVVGLSRAPTIEGAVFPNKLKDYVGNLERFVQGFTVAFPTAVATPDTEVLTLPGPDVRIEEEHPIDGTVSERLSQESQGWSFYCPATETWTSHPGVGEFPLATTTATMCDGDAPTQARYTFWLDPWGRFKGTISSSPLTERHNVRWRRMAVNLTGTGIRDCELAVDPTACYSDSFIRYSLKQAGPVWVTNHMQHWRSLNVPTGQIELGKALATEEWVDPIANSWNEPFVASVSRGELFGRPIGGSYELTLELTPDIRLERIERVQILAETDYWVRQD